VVGGKEESTLLGKSVWPFFQLQHWLLLCLWDSSWQRIKIKFPKKYGLEKMNQVYISKKLSKAKSFFLKSYECNCYFLKCLTCFTSVLERQGRTEASMYFASSVNLTNIAHIRHVASNYLGFWPSPRINFINVLRAAFTHTEPKIVKRYWDLTEFLHFWELHVEAARKYVGEIDHWLQPFVEVWEVLSWWIIELRGKNAMLNETIM